MENEDLKYLLSLTQVPKIGYKTARTLIAYCGSAEGVFREKKSHLTKISGIGKNMAESISTFTNFQLAENEIAFSKKYNIICLSYLDKSYPRRLKEIEDAPLVLFCKGKAELNYPRMLAVVGTRRPTGYGRKLCHEIVEGLKAYEVSIVSGLALGIDAMAHRTALDSDLETIGVLAHGLHTIYPAQNRGLALEMAKGRGAILTEYFSETIPEKTNFPDRNRIVAGMSDAVLIVETAKRGGALITGEIAFSYSRDVFAVPGRTTDEMSAGCNHFIKINKAAMVQTAEDIAYIMGWNIRDGKEAPAPRPEVELEPEEEKIVGLLRDKGKLNIDNLCLLSGTSPSELFMQLLNLELKGVVQSLPGKVYGLI